MNPALLAISHPEASSSGGETGTGELKVSPQSDFLLVSFQITKCNFNTTQHVALAITFYETHLVWFVLFVNNLSFGLDCYQDGSSTFRLSLGDAQHSRQEPKFSGFIHITYLFN